MAISPKDIRFNPATGKIILPGQPLGATNQVNSNRVARHSSPSHKNAVSTAPIPEHNYSVGDVGLPNTPYDGMTLAYFEGFDQPLADLVMAPHKPRGKYLTSQTYRPGSRQPSGQLTIAYDSDPYNTGPNDNNRGVPIGSDNISISNSVLKLGARYGTAQERTLYNRELVASCLMSDFAVNAYPGIAGSQDIIIEWYMRSVPNGPNLVGSHSDFWTSPMEPPANSSPKQDINFENDTMNQVLGGIGLDPGSPGGFSPNNKWTDFGSWHRISFLLNKDTQAGVKVYRDGVLWDTGRFNGGLGDAAIRLLITAHVVTEETILSEWINGVTYALEIDDFRVWNRPSAKRYKPLVTMPDVNINFGSSTTITLPPAISIWGEVPTVEYVQQIQVEVNEPGGADNVSYGTKSNPFPTGVSYNAGTRTITVAPTSAKAGRMAFVVHARTAGSVCEPLRFNVNVGPVINFRAISFVPGIAGTYEVYSKVDCGVLVTDGVNKTKVISFTELPSGFSYNDTTGYLSWDTTATDPANATINATNSIGQTTSGTINITLGSVPINGEDIVLTNAINSMTVSPTQARRVLLNTFISGLRSDGVLTKLDWLTLFAAHDSQAGLINMIQPTKNWTTVGGIVAFTSDRGYAGDGVASYMSMNETVTAASNMASQNNSTIGIWCNQQNGATGLLPHFSELIAGSRFDIRARGTSGNETFKCADGTGDVLRASTLTRVGHRSASRTDAAVKKGYFNGSLTATLTTASTGGGAANGCIAKASTTYCADRFAAFYSGTGLTDAEQTAMHNRLNTYLTAIGAN